jgi:hypothetical protein
MSVDGGIDGTRINTREDGAGFVRSLTKLNNGVQIMA